MNILILGTSGMIGRAMLRAFAQRSEWSVTAVSRSPQNFSSTSDKLKLISGMDILAPDALAQIFASAKPNVVINCIGLTKHLAAGNDPLWAIPTNALLPHRLAVLCEFTQARLIHISTDCVFLGTQGNYKETDEPDSTDVYGRSKALGEVVNSPSALTIRTSTIGHENDTKHGLLEWFLSQKKCKGFSRAIFSGLPTIVLAEVVRDIIVPNAQLSGLLHVGGLAISKADLLKTIATIYNRSDIELVNDEQFVIDRSLDSSHFYAATGYTPPSWPELIQMMHSDYLKKST